MTHQTQITAIMIADNNIGDDGMKHLTECMCTIKQLTLLDVSNNKITEEGARALLNMFEKATRPVCQLLEHLDLSENPIGNDGFRSVLKLGQYVHLKVLKLNRCGITEHAFTEANKPQINLDRIESIDLSNNQMKQGIMSCIITALSPNLITDLELENVGVEGNVLGNIAAFLDSAKELKLRRFNLSNCKLVDGQFMRIFR